MPESLERAYIPLGAPLSPPSFPSYDSNFIASRLFIPPLVSLPTRRFSAFASTSSVARIANRVCLIHAARYAREPESSLFFHRLVLRVLISRHDDEAAAVRSSVSSFSSLFAYRNPPPRSTHAVVSTISIFCRESEIIARSQHERSIHFRQSPPRSIALWRARRPERDLRRARRASGGRIFVGIAERCCGNLENARDVL